MCGCGVGFGGGGIGVGLCQGAGCGWCDVVVMKATGVSGFGGGHACPNPGAWWG